MTGTALDAARLLATVHGLPATDAAVLHAGSNVVVHLAPAPVVVRVMTGTAALHADPAGWLQREVGVCGHLARLGAPVVAPSDELPPGPHEVDGLWMTCWAHVAVDRDAPAPAPGRLGRSLRELHAAMARVSVPLEPLAVVRDEIAGLLDGLTGPQARAWRDELDDLPPAALGTGGAGQPIHGDASLSNLLATTDGRRLWTDFEDVRCGPIENDVAGVITAARDRGLGADYEAAVLSAYGTVDRDVLEAQIRLHDLYGAVWRAHARTRSAAPR